MRSEATYDVLAPFAPLGPQRVWSLVISVFGDLARDEAQWIDGPLLTLFLGEMGVKSDALRVALHRLRADGWLISEKVGRVARHTLSPKARRESQLAAQRIYGTAAPSGSWHMVLINDGTDPDRDAYLPFAPRMFVGGPASVPPRDALVLSPTEIPAWASGQLGSDALVDDYAKLERCLLTLIDELPAPGGLSALQTAVVRCLIVHNWRRLVLKHPDLPVHLFRSDWRGAACKALVGELLARLPRPNPADITL